MCKDTFNFLRTSEVAKLSPGDVLVLENLRFYPNEGSKDKEQRLVMAKKLASYADLYVSDAFGTAHRDAASMTGVPEVGYPFFHCIFSQYFQVLGQGASGYLMKKEIDYFSKALKNPEKPVVAIVGVWTVRHRQVFSSNCLLKYFGTKDKLRGYISIGGQCLPVWLKSSYTP